jgi:3-hydroxybutyrate dehydrogenase
MVPLTRWRVGAGRRPGEPRAMTTGSTASLTGRIALVTGASKGIDRAIVVASVGVRVAITARDFGSGRTVAEECGRGSLAPALDVQDEAACTRTMEEVERTSGLLDILVNNAGIAESSKFTDIDTPTWRLHLTVDLDGPFWLTRAASPGMFGCSQRRVISIGSVGWRIGLAYAHYTATKHRLLGLPRGLASKYPRSGMTFNCVCSYCADTPITETTIRNIVAKTARTYDNARAILLTPQGTLVSADDVAALCVFVASDVATSITGQALQIDGGKVQCQGLGQAPIPGWSAVSPSGTGRSSRTWSSFDLSESVRERGDECFLLMFNWFRSTTMSSSRPMPG